MKYSPCFAYKHLMKFLCHKTAERCREYTLPPLAGPAVLHAPPYLGCLTVVVHLAALLLSYSVVQEEEGIRDVPVYQGRSISP